MKLIGTTGENIFTGLPTSSLFGDSGYPAVARLVTDQKARVVESNGHIKLIHKIENWLNINQVCVIYIFITYVIAINGLPGQLSVER